MMTKSPLVTVPQAAEELSLSVHTIRGWIAQRKLAHVRLGRAIRIPRTEIERLLERGTVPALHQGPTRVARRG